MKPLRLSIACILMLLLAGRFSPAQSQTGGTNNNSVVPTLVNFSGFLTDGTGKPLTGMTGVTFSLYKEQQGGAPLWMETQNVHPDKSGHYKVTLGSTKSQGLPPDLFASGEARWLGVQAQGQAEQARVMLLSVPYALKAGDAQTVGGLPPSAFVLAAPSSRTAIPVAPGSATIGGSGTANYIPIWTDSADLGNSVLYQTTAGLVGIGTTTPTAALEIGTGDVSIDGGNLNLPQTVTGKPSATNIGIVNMGGLPFLHACCGASALNTFVGTNAGNFSLTGRANTGIGVGVLAAVTDGGNNTATGYSALSRNTEGSYNTATGLNALSLNTTGSANTATGTSALTNNTTGTDNTASGASALANDTTGNYNTANGLGALQNNSTGNSNTAVGLNALGTSNGNNNTATGNGAGASNTTGSQNTFIGYSADASGGSLTNATAIGANAIVSESNAMVLGGTGANAVSVGIGTATPAYTLDVQGTGNFTGLITFAPGQTFPGSGTITGVATAAGSGLTGGGTSGNLNLSLLNSCASGQILQWSGSGWVCSNAGTGTITGVTAGTDLTGGGTVGNVTLNVDTTQVPQLGTANSFAATQTVNGLVAITGAGNGVQFPDGTLQTTAASGGGVPSGFMILGSTPTAPPGYTLSGTIVSGNAASSLAPMPTARSELGVATVSGKIYAIGGVLGGKPQQVNEAYDPVTNSWSKQKPMPSGRAYFAAAAVPNGDIWAIGGVGQGSGTVEIYFPTTNGWSSGPQLPTAREGLAAAVYLNDVFAIGGFNTTKHYLTDFLESSGSSWSALKPMPSGRAYLAAAEVNGQIYAIGGYDGHSVLDTVEVYDIQHQTWTAAAAMPTARRDLAAVVLNNKIYAIGGSNGQSALNLVEVYDPSTNTWSAAPSPLAARTQFGAVALNGLVYLMGGAAGTGILGTVEQYSPPQTLYTFTKD